MKTCPDCSFGNFDHVTHCVKCGTSFAVAERVFIDTDPPRAKRKRPTRERFYQLRRKAGFRWKEPFKKQQKESRAPADWELLVNLFLPGFYQFKNGCAALGFFCSGLVVGGFLCAYLHLQTPLLPFFCLIVIAGFAMSFYDALGGKELRSFFSASAPRETRIEWWTMLPDLLLPGFYQFRKRRFVRGMFYSGLFLLGWILYYFSIGTIYVMWALALAALGAVLSLCDIFRFTSWPFRQRLLFSLLLSFFAFQIIHQSYWRITDDLIRGEDYIMIGREFAGTELNPGEWATELLAPPDLRPGDIVRVRMARFVYGANEFIDRLLAGPGDRVSIHNGTLLRNGETTFILPLNAAYQLPTLPERTLGEHEFLIYPSVAQANNGYRWTEEFAVISQRGIISRLESIDFPVWRRRSLVNREEVEYIPLVSDSKQE